MRLMLFRIWCETQPKHSGEWDEAHRAAARSNKFAEPAFPLDAPPNVYRNASGTQRCAVCGNWLLQEEIKA